MSYDDVVALVDAADDVDAAIAAIRRAALRLAETDYDDERCELAASADCLRDHEEHLRRLASEEGR